MVKEIAIKTMWLVLILVVIILLVWYLYHENTALQVNKKVIINSKLPETFDGYKIAHISDFHNTTSNKLAGCIINKIKDSKVDIVVITGDLIDSRRTNTKVAMEFVKELVKSNVVYYVPGNHESRIQEYEEFKKEIEKIGVNVLDNKAEQIIKNGDKINLLGIKDPAFSYEYSLDEHLILKQEIESLAYDKSIYTILLSHRPEQFTTYVEQNIDLVLTGHAHGGQIRLPFIGGIIAPVQGFFPKYTEGIHKENNTTMVISRGIGNSIFPFRINNRPELLLIELKNK